MIAAFAVLALAIPGSPAAVCPQPTARAQFASHTRVVYRQATVTAVDKAKLMRLEVCAPTADRRWMRAYRLRIHKAYLPIRQMARWDRDCADKPTWRVRACIRYAAAVHGVDAGRMLRAANCESGFDPKATSGFMGLFQYLPGTWAGTPYAKKSPWSARWSSMATAWKWRQGHHGEWPVCAYV